MGGSGFHYFGDGEMSKLQARLKEAGWTLNCQRFIDLYSDQTGTLGARTCTWRAVKGELELIVKAKLGQDAEALRYLYDVAKTIDPDLQQIAMESGSGGWVFDLSQGELDSNP
jgi:hypothetical protein